MPVKAVKHWDNEPHFTLGMLAIHHEAAVESNSAPVCVPKNETTKVRWHPPTTDPVPRPVD